MLIGLARTSTEDQKAGLEAQIISLQSLGCEKVFVEEVSSVAKRPVLEQAIEFCREGDVLVVTTLSRLARSVPHMWQIIERLDAKKVAIRIVDMGLDSSTSTGRLMLSVLGAVAQFEREIMLERQQIGIKKAKQQGKFKGRVPTAQRKAEAVLALRDEGVSPSEIGQRLRISRASVYRILGPAR